MAGMARLQHDETGERAIALSREFLHRYWAKDAAWIRDVLDDGFMWIGAQRDMYDAGTDMFMDTYEEMCARMPHVRIAEEEFSLVLSEPTVCICVGRFMGAVDAHSGRHVAGRERLTFVWRVVSSDAGTDADADECATGSGAHNANAVISTAGASTGCRSARRTRKAALPELKLSHLHISAPTSGNGVKEPFPSMAGKDGCRYRHELIGSELEQDRAIALSDAAGVTHWIGPESVLSAESRGRQTILHTSSGDIVLPSYLTQTVERFDGIVKRVHRCYAVNPLHVKSFHGTDLTLDDGTRIPVPVRRVSEVQELLGISK